MSHPLIHRHFAVNVFQLIAVGEGEKIEVRDVFDEHLTAPPVGHVDRRRISGIMRPAWIGRKDIVGKNRRDAPHEIVVVDAIIDGDNGIDRHGRGRIGIDAPTAVEQLHVADTLELRNVPRQRDLMGRIIDVCDGHDEGIPRWRRQLDRRCPAKLAVKNRVKFLILGHIIGGIGFLNLMRHQRLDDRIGNLKHRSVGTTHRKSLKVGKGGHNPKFRKLVRIAMVLKGQIIGFTRLHQTRLAPATQSARIEPRRITGAAEVALEEEFGIAKIGIEHSTRIEIAKILIRSRHQTVRRNHDDRCDEDRDEKFDQ